MADSMCGPSNGAKNLLAHADRDRTRHQDRLVNAPSTSSGNAFRSQVPFSNGAEMAFGGFQQASAPVDAAFGPGLDLHALNPMAPNTQAARAYGHAVPGIPTAMGNVGPGAPAARLASPATGGASHQEWVSQFAGMQLGPGAPGPSTAMPAHAHPATPTPMNLQSAAPFAMPMFNGAPATMFGFQNPAMSSTASPQQLQTGVPQDAAAAAIDVEAFNRAFGEYDDANFQSELADWTEKQKLANSEFLEAQDKWMAEHGPRTEASSWAAETAAAVASTTAETKPPTAQEMEEIDADLEQLAQEQDKKRRTDDELARAAVDIVNSVADNTSDKFKNSRFFELMRRIGNREVVVEGDSFVNATTGETVNTEHDDDGAGNNNGNTNHSSRGPDNNSALG